MKKSRTKARSRKSKRVSSTRKGLRQPVDLAAIREQITNLIKDQAVPMVEITIEEVDKGHYPAMKYLFELIGLYPAPSQEETTGEDSLAGTLLRRLRLPEEPLLEPEVTKDSESEPLTVAGDALE